MREGRIECPLEMEGGGWQRILMDAYMALGAISTNGWWMAVGEFE